MFFYRKLSISESIDDMKAYTRLTDHVYYHILNFADDALENIPEDQRPHYSLMQEVSFARYNTCIQRRFAFLVDK